MNLENVLYEKQDGIAFVTLNRPKVLNALNTPTWTDLRTAFEGIDNLDFPRINGLMEEARAQNVSLDGPTLGFALRKTIRRLSEQFLENPDDRELMKKLESAAGVARSLPFEVNVWRAQNNYYQVLQKLYPERVEKAAAGDAAAREWIEHFMAVGQNLAVKVEPLAVPELQAAS